MLSIAKCNLYRYNPDPSVIIVEVEEVANNLTNATNVTLLMPTFNLTEGNSTNNTNATKYEFVDPCPPGGAVQVLNYFYPWLERRLVSTLAPMK